MTPPLYTCPSKSTYPINENTPPTTTTSHSPTAHNPTTILHLLQLATLMEHPLPMAYQGEENTVELRIYHPMGNIQRVGLLLDNQNILQAPSTTMYVALHLTKNNTKHSLHGHIQHQLPLRHRQPHPPRHAILPTQSLIHITHTSHKSTPLPQKLPNYCPTYPCTLHNPQH